MILVDYDFLNKTEIDYLLDMWDETIVQFSKKVIHFYAIDFLKHHIDIRPIHNGKFHEAGFKKIRLQKYNEHFSQIEQFHGHENYFNYILFLNDDFEGGELEFANGIIIKPKKGSLVYFNNNERHRVLPCKGDRYVFTLLGDVEAKLKFNSIINKQTTLI